MAANKAALTMLLLLLVLARFIVLGMEKYDAGVR